MDFGLSKEQQSLRDAVRELFRRACDTGKFGAVEGTERRWSRDVWQSLADTGILGLAVPEEYGGGGAGPVEIAVTMAEIGRALALEPVLDAAVVPAEVLARSKDELQRQTYLAGIASGQLLGAVAHDERGDRWPTRGVTTVAEPSGDLFFLTGAKHLVPHGDCADFFIVSARLDGDVALFLVNSVADGLTVTPYHSPDRRSGAHLGLDRVQAVRLDAGDASEVLRRAESLEQIALCAEAVGAMDEILHITTDYLRSRRQFGAPLSTFQALAHRAADMYVLVELARSMSLYGTAALEDDVDDPLIVSRVKLQICRSARVLGHEGIHMHGGIGVTDEYSVGQYAARLMSIENRLGGSLEHLEVLAEAVDAHDKVILG